MDRKDFEPTHMTFHDGPAPAGVVRWSIKTLGNARPAASSLEG